MLARRRTTPADPTMNAPTTVARCILTTLAIATSSSTSRAQDSGIAGRSFSSALQGFEARRLRGVGKFISDSALRDANGVRLSQLLVQRAGITLGPGRFGGEFPVSSRMCRGDRCSEPRCYIRVFTDGVLVFDGTPDRRDAQGFDTLRLRTEDFSGIEYYSGAAGIPPAFGGANTDCGTLLFWSRES
jgi:hypothetical protein